MKNFESNSTGSVPTLKTEIIVSTKTNAATFGGNDCRKVTGRSITLVIEVFNPFLAPEKFALIETSKFMATSILIAFCESISLNFS
jgi:hypothetical protein